MNGWWLLPMVPAVTGAYAYAVYPRLAARLAARRPAEIVPQDPAEWPAISVTVPVYNEATVVSDLIESLLLLPYPAGRRQIVIVSDCSTDGTDEIVRRFADRGVELVRLPERSGKSAAENYASAHLRGEIIVNTDATTRIVPSHFLDLIRVFADPRIGTASGRDISIGHEDAEANIGESTYTDFEMTLRDHETRIGSIIGSSGCYYAIRRALHRDDFPANQSRDFASALLARRAGLRAVAVNSAVCLVPRASSLRTELPRKVRTMTRGLTTLWAFRDLLSPRRHGVFAWMLASHKLSRWLVWLTLPLAPIGLLLVPPALAATARTLLLLGTVGALAGALAIRWPGAGRPPRPLALCGFALVAALAGSVAWWRFLSGGRNPIWEPTRRPDAAIAAVQRLSARELAR